MSSWSRAGWSIVLAVGLLMSGALPAWAEPAYQGGEIHVVKAGETLSSIAARYGITASALAQANGLSNYNYIYAGQRLRVPGASASTTASAAGGIHVVRAGESLASIALQYGTSPQAIATANGLSNWNFIFAGQRLKIPSGSSSAAASNTTSSAGNTVHVVQAGQSLSAIASMYGVTAAALAQANQLSNPNFVYTGQRLTIPKTGTATTSSAPAAPAPGSPNDGRWIDVSLSTQTLTAYEGQTPVFSTRISSGLPRTPTVTGRYAIQSKYASVHMSGPGYSLPNVPWTMFFYKGYAIHGAYWHNNFGRPMSHGCINVSPTDAAWLFKFASIGTPVVIHQ